MAHQKQARQKNKNVKEAYHKWYSPNLQEEAELLVFGYAGRPVILFATSMGRYYEAKDRGLIGSVQWFIDNGDITVYCPGNIDHRSWYDKDLHPADRAIEQQKYDQFILEEVYSRATAETGRKQVITAGCSFGGYHAANFGFRHPDITDTVISMSGIFDIASHTDGFENDTIYYNNPMAFLRDDNRPELWAQRVILGTTWSDICLEQNQRMAGILENKKMLHWLDIRGDQPHDWPVWKQMFPHYISITL
ncbi:esterase family protein [Arachidicoccus terrestris]|uniref:esterase family protein n=1 Tax=Arachidicoccus terrestris TaxID=2875539 RepID=UPI001CC39FC3|nr:alpha/beta hydrolase-fold protein [Arachidicoccus terrestris]UAY54311.1 esterase [Arachidicoccus terrestris]